MSLETQPSCQYVLGFIFFCRFVVFFVCVLGFVFVFVILLSLYRIRCGPGPCSDMLYYQ